MTTSHRIDLAPLSRAQLKELAVDLSQELEAREHEDKLALEEKLRTLVEEAGFNPDGLRFAGTGKRRTRKQQQTDGASDE